LHESVAEYS